MIHAIRPVRHRVIDSPIGPLTLVADSSGALTRILTDGQRHAPPASALGPRDDELAPEAVDQLADYFAGRRMDFQLRTAPRGTAFQHRVWAAIAAVPAGQTRSYGQVAHDLGAPGSARAVGAATGRNPLSIVVPCHRLVSSAGALTGYAGGLDRKRWLLAHEQGLGSESPRA